MSGSRTPGWDNPAPFGHAPPGSQPTNPFGLPPVRRTSTTSLPAGGDRPLQGQASESADPLYLLNLTSTEPYQDAAFSQHTTSISADSGAPFVRRAPSRTSNTPYPRSQARPPPIISSGWRSQAPLPVEQSVLSTPWSSFPASGFDFTRETSYGHRAISHGQAPRVNTVLPPPPSVVFPPLPVASLTHGPPFRPQNISFGSINPGASDARDKHSKEDVVAESTVGSLQMTLRTALDKIAELEHEARHYRAERDKIGENFTAETSRLRIQRNQFKADSMEFFRATEAMEAKMEAAIAARRGAEKKVERMQQEIRELYEYIHRAIGGSDSFMKALEIEQPKKSFEYAESSSSAGSKGGTTDLQASPFSTQSVQDNISALSVSSQSTPTPTAITKIVAHGVLNHRLDSFFINVEDWGEEFARVGSNDRGADAEGFRKMRDYCFALCRIRDFEELVNHVRLRKYLVAAIICSKLTTFFGAKCLEGFASMTTELATAIQDLGHVSPQDPKAHHEILVRRANAYRAVLQQPNLGPWLEARVRHVGDDLAQMLRCMIEDEKWTEAVDKLHKLVKDAFDIGQRMITTAKEWSVKNATRGERWDPHSMNQRDARLAGEPLLTDSNGFAFVVKIGVAPSITERDYSKGTMSLSSLRLRDVLLAHNLNQRTSPENARKSLHSS